MKLIGVFSCITVITGWSSQLQDVVSGVGEKSSCSHFHQSLIHLVNSYAYLAWKNGAPISNHSLYLGVNWPLFLKWGSFGKGSGTENPAKWCKVMMSSSWHDLQTHRGLLETEPESLIRFDDRTAKLIGSPGSPMFLVVALAQNSVLRKKAMVDHNHFSPTFQWPGWLGSGSKWSTSRNEWSILA